MFQTLFISGFLSGKSMIDLLTLRPPVIAFVDVYVATTLVL